ncbi:MAG: DUF2202 domain-containing protein [Epsilonproteobacteria bacterium]|nr:DUF2202 domain-containing protein [Campylobacterota bacterium]
MKKSIAAISMVMAGMFIGCGGGSSSSTSATEVSVERGPVLRAVVIDSNGKMAREMGGGKYQFLDTPKYPVIATGGYIDVNRDGILSEGDINNTITYYTKDGKSVTLVSSIAENPDIREYLKTTYNLTDEQIDNDTPSTNNTIAAISDAVFAYMISNGIYDPKNLTLDDVKSLESQIQNQLAVYEQTQDKAQVEAQLVNQLGLKPLSSDDIQNIISTGNNIDSRGMANLVNTLPKYELSDEDKEALAHMWNEEKLAHDVYLALYKLYPLNTLYTIATQSEAEHEASVQDLIAKYDLNILSPDFSGGYDPEALAAYGEGEFSIQAITDLYNQLYDLGKTSDIDALKVGCMVEVTDINDLDNYINSGEITPDMLIVFSNLRNGSYHHYWAFDGALKALGVSDGCCSVGEEYCKTPEEYPIQTGNPNAQAQSGVYAGSAGYHGGR